MGDLKKVSARELDILLKNLQDQKLSFVRVARDIVSLAPDLKGIRSRVASQESFAIEIQTRQNVETRARYMEEEVRRLQKCLEERNVQLQAVTFSGEPKPKELENPRELSIVKAIADASEVAAESEFVDMLRELELQERDAIQKHLTDEISRIKEEINHVVLGCERQTPEKNCGNIVELVNARNEEIARLHDEIKMMSAHWNLKTQEMDSLLDKHRSADQEIKKTVLKVEFFLQEARSQTQNLQMTDRRDKPSKELEQLVLQGHASDCVYKQNFWESTGFKIFVSMTMFALVVFAKQ